MSERAPTLAELRRLHLEEGRPLSAELEAALRVDARAGARALLAAIERRRSANRAEGQRLRRLLRFEEELWSAGVLHVAGVDEAGMSPLAGPVVAGAVILRPGGRIPGVDDSKKLDAARREALAPRIREEAVAWAIGVVEPEEIDRINIYRAGLLAMRRAVEGLSVRPQHLLIDARQLRELAIPQQGIIQGDAKSLSIGAASILAKTTRDAMMRELDVRHPGYGLARHKGYPVKEHVEALERLGPSPIHRRTFAPVRKVIESGPRQRPLFPELAPQDDGAATPRRSPAAPRAR